MEKNGIQIKITYDLRGAEKDLARLEARLARLQKREQGVGRLKSNYKALGQEAEEAAARAEAALHAWKDAEARASRRKQAVKRRTLNKDPGAGEDTVNQAVAADAPMQAMAAAAERARGQYAELNGQSEELNQKHLGLGGVLGMVQVELRGEEQAAEDVAGKMREAGTSTDWMEKAKKVLGVLAGALKRAASTVGALAKGLMGLAGKLASAVGKLLPFRTVMELGRLAAQGLGRAVRAVADGAKEGLGNLARYSSDCNAGLSALSGGLTQMKNSFAAAFAPILSVAAPVLTRLMSLVTGAANAIGMLFAALTGAKSFTKATAVSEDYAASLEGTGKAAEETKRTLAGFDELSILEGGGAQASGGSGGAAPGEMFEEVELPDWSLDVAGLFRDQDWEGLGTAAAVGINAGLAALGGMIAWDSVGGAITNVVSGITGTLNALVAGMDWLGLGTTLGGGVNTLLQTLFLLLTEVDWPGIGAALAAGLNGMLSAVDWGLLGETLGAWFNMFIGTGLGFVQTFDWVGAGLALAGALMGMVGTIDWAGLGTLIGDALIGAFTFLSTAIQNFDWVQFGEDVKTMLVSVDWSGVFTAMCEAMGSAFGGLVGFLWGLIQDAWKDVVDWWHDVAFEDGQFTLQGLLDGIVQVVSNIGSWIVENVFQPFMDGFREAFGIHSPSAVMAEMGGYMIDGLKEGLTGLWEKVSGFFSEAVDGIKNLFSLESLQSIGSNAVSGFINGLKSVGSKVAGWGADILGDLKNALGIHSPSTETESVGEYTVAGYINGLNASLPQLGTALSAVANTVVTLLQGAGAALLLRQEEDQNAALAALGTWMEAVEGLFSAFYGNLNSQAAAWAGGLQKTLNGMVASAKAAAASIAANLSSAGGGLSAQTGNGAAARAAEARGNAARAVTLKVPAYATGAVLPANSPHLAIVGDQKYGTNIETQMRTMVAAFHAALDSRSGEREIVNELREILSAVREDKVLMVDKRELGRTAREAMDAAARAGYAGLSVR